MDHRATKDRAEKEQEEVERLVRPAPKVKPPRHDKRRERVEVDHDPDLDLKDRDLSKNYKEIGGSVGLNVLNRWADEEAKPKPAAAPKPAAPKPKAPPKPKEPEKKKVKVRNRESDWVGWISEDSFKRLKNEYEAVDDSEEEEKTPAKQPSAPVAPKPEPGKPHTEEAAPAGTADLSTKKELEALGTGNVQVKWTLDNISDPNGVLGHFADKYPAENLLQGQKLPESVKTVGDLRRILRTVEPAPDAPAVPVEKKPGKKAPKPKAKPGKAPPSQATPPAEQAAPAATPAAAPAATPAAAPAATPEQPAAPAESAPAAPAGAPKGDEANGEDAPKHEAPQLPQRRPVSKEEQADAINLIYGSFPEAVSAKLLMIDPPLHPDDVQTLVSDFHVAKSVPMTGNLDDLIKKASGFYSMSPSQVAPPKWVKDKKGKKMPFAELPPEAQHEALREHQLRTVAMSLAAREAVAAQFKRSKAPDDLADAMSDFMLYNSKETQESPEQREHRAAKKASLLFYNAIGGGLHFRPKGRMPEEPVKEEESEGPSEAGADGKAKPKKKKTEKAAPKPPKPSKDRQQERDRFNRHPDERQQVFDAPVVPDQAIKNILKATKDPAVKRLAVGYFQGQDYIQARKKFLDASSPDAVSERFPIDTIAKRLNKASDWLRKRSDLYPENLLAQDTSKTFRSRIMKQLRVLQPEKAAAVQSHLDEYDNKQYDKAAAAYPKALQKYESKRNKAESDTTAEYEKYSARLKQDPNWDGPPPLSTEDRLAAQEIVEPREPKKPARYDMQRRKPADLEASAKDMWDDFSSRNASQLSVRVAIRGCQHLFSTYPKPSAMGRTAVYWGVAPYGDSKPYEGWQQPHARDLGDDDWTRVLKAARVWLKSPMLSKNVEGVVRDTQLRAALDLALRDENLSSALHPVLYNHLLARLAGVPEDETLLTVTASETARNTMSKKVELETAQADKFLERLDRMASEIQKNHSEWFKEKSAAKALVNEIDKLADEVETAVYGPASMLRRQASVLGIKVGEVIQRDSDEKYMDTFKNPQAPHQTEADEPYMKAYKDDQSSAVNHGKSTTGKPLAK